MNNTGVETRKENTAKGTKAIRKLNLLCEASQEVASSQRLSRLVGQVTQIAQGMFNASASSVLLLDDEDRNLIFEVAGGRAGEQLRGARIGAQYGIAGWVVSHGQPLIVNDVNSDQRFNQIIDAVTGFMTRSIMCAPLVAQGKVIGVIEVLNKLDRSNFNDHDLKTLMSMAATTALAINQAWRHQHDDEPAT